MGAERHTPTPLDPPPGQPPSGAAAPLDSPLLSAILASSFDLDQVARDHAIPTHVLYTWLFSPRTQTLIDKLLQASLDFHDIRLANARASAAGVLESLALTADTPPNAAAPPLPSSA